MSSFLFFLFIALITDKLHPCFRIFFLQHIFNPVCPASRARTAKNPDTTFAFFASNCPDVEVPLIY